MLSARLIRISMCTAIAAIALMAGPSANAFSNKIRVEGVSDYSACCGGSHDCDVQGYFSASSFLGIITYNNTTWVGEEFPLYNGNVWDTDFCDPDKTGNANDDDTDWMDKLGDGIAFYAGHGIPEAYPGDGHPTYTPQSCVNTDDCYAHRDPNYSLPVVCQNESPTAHYCTYYSGRSPYLCGDDAHHNNVPDLTDHARFGESSDSGAWGGAGTNGGVNMVVLDMSHPVEPGMEYAQLGVTFAGLHILGTMMVVSGDVGAYGGRGAFFADRWSSGNDTTDSIAWAWLYVLGDMGYSGDPCGFGGGYGGMNGCGAFVTFGVDATSTTALWHLDGETWEDVRSDGYDATGGAYMKWRKICNYDCGTHPMVLY